MDCPEAGKAAGCEVMNLATCQNCRNIMSGHAARLWSLAGPMTVLPISWHSSLCQSSDTALMAREAKHRIWRPTARCHACFLLLPFNTASSVYGVHVRTSASHRRALDGRARSRQPGVERGRLMSLIDGCMRPLLTSRRRIQHPG
jgi:hypothetical protein